MGTSRRYAEHYDRLMERRITEMLIRPAPVTLSPAEQDFEADPIQHAREPLPVRGWVRYPETAARVEAKAIAWTSRAVQL